MEKKYILTEKTIIFNNKKLYRIKAVKNFGNVKKNDIGGFVESEENLSQEDDCWIYNNAKVYDNAKIFGRASIMDNAIVCNHAWVFDFARVKNNAKIIGNERIFGFMTVFSNKKDGSYEKWNI